MYAVRQEILKGVNCSAYKSLKKIMGFVETYKRILDEIMRK